MSRAAAGDVVVVKPLNNVYTVMVVVATAVQVLAFLVLFLRFKSQFGVYLFQS